VADPVAAIAEGGVQKNATTPGSLQTVVLFSEVLCRRNTPTGVSAGVQVNCAKRLDHKVKHPLRCVSLISCERVSVEGVFGDP